MILNAVFLCKLLLAAAAAGILSIGRKSLTGRQKAGIVGALLLCAFGANFAASFLPDLTDEITLTALNERSAESHSPEIAVEGFVIDGESRPVKKIIDGQWFWRGHRYMWMPESIAYQPKGTTQSVTLGVPVGWARSIQFSANAYKGIVEVRAGETVQRVDTSVTGTVEIGRSKTALLLLNSLRELAAYALVFLAAALAVGWFVKKYVICRRVRQAAFWMGLTCICVFILAFMIQYCSVNSFFRDEMTLITYITQTDSMIQALKTDIAWAPLWKGIMFLWYRIVPYGERWLMLLPELYFLPGICLVAMSGRMLWNERVGLIAALLTATHARLIYRAASDLTCYSLLFTMCAAVLYLYLKRFRWKREFSWQALLPFIVGMTLASYTHYFGFFLSGTCFLIDFGFVVRKKKSAGYLIPYGIAGALYVPWLFYIFTVGNAVGANYWQPAPTIASVREFIANLSGVVPVRYYILIFSFLLAAVTALRCWKKRECPEPYQSACLLAAIPLILFIGVFAYGKWIAIGNTFWVWRYFIAIVPCFMLLSAWAVEEVLLFLMEKRKESARAVAYGLIACVLCVVCSKSCDMARQWCADLAGDSFEGQAEWLFSECCDYLYDPNTAILLGAYSSNLPAMRDYYIAQKGVRAPADEIHMRIAGEVSKEELQKYEHIVFLYTIREAPRAAELNQWLNDNYSVSKKKREVMITEPCSLL